MWTLCQQRTVSRLNLLLFIKWTFINWQSPLPVPINPETPWNWRHRWSRRQNCIPQFNSNVLLRWRSGESLKLLLQITIPLYTMMDFLSSHIQSCWKTDRTSYRAAGWRSKRYHGSTPRDSEESSVASSVVWSQRCRAASQLLKSKLKVPALKVCFNNTLHVSHHHISIVWSMNFTRYFLLNTVERFEPNLNVLSDLRPEWGRWHLAHPCAQRTRAAAHNVEATLKGHRLPKVSRHITATNMYL